MTSPAALMPGHFLTTRNTSPRGSNRITNVAECECGHRLNWETRDEDHTLHLLAMAWEKGWAAGWVERSPWFSFQGEGFSNPFKNEEDQ